jgi:hypothetical protein
MESFGHPTHRLILGGTVFHRRCSQVLRRSATDSAILRLFSEERRKGVEGGGGGG